MKNLREKIAVLIGIYKVVNSREYQEERAERIARLHS